MSPGTIPLVFFCIHSPDKLRNTTFLNFSSFTAKTNMVLFHMTAIGSVTAAGNWNLQFWIVKGFAILYLDQTSGKIMLDLDVRVVLRQVVCFPCGFISAVLHKTAYFHSRGEYANHLGPKSEQRIYDSADFWGVFNS